MPDSTCEDLMLRGGRDTSWGGAGGGVGGRAEGAVYVLYFTCRAPRRTLSCAANSHVPRCASAAGQRRKEARDTTCRGLGACDVVGPGAHEWMDPGARLVPGDRRHRLSRPQIPGATPTFRAADLSEFHLRGPEGAVGQEQGRRAVRVAAWSVRDGRARTNPSSREQRRARAATDLVEIHSTPSPIAAHATPRPSHPSLPSALMQFCSLMRLAHD